MATYSKGNITNKAIIDAGKKLFYEKGYVATYCNDIAAEANVNPGLIYYYFKTKGAIAEKIFIEFLLGMQKTIAALFPDESLLIRRAVDLRTYFYTIVHEEKIKRFLYEISLERIPHKLAQGIGMDYFDTMNEEFPFEHEEEMLAMVCLCSFAIETEMIIGYTEGYFHFSDEKLAEFDIKTTFELMSLPYNKINHILELSKVLFSRLHIKIMPGFDIRISLKRPIK
jgi:AcrR family transcriptional regulator